jgi:hypothetical protein
MKLRVSEMGEGIPHDLKPMIEDAARFVADLGTKSGQMISDWIDEIVDAIF